MVENFERFKYRVYNEEGEIIARCMFYDHAKAIVTYSGGKFWIDKF